MNLSPSFNLESLNLDIESYNKEELMQILRIPNDYNKDQVTKNKNSLQGKINKLSIDNLKKYNYLLFLDNAEKKLLNNYFNSNGHSEQEIMINSLTNMELKNNTISNYDNNFIIENKSIVHNPLKNITVGQYNDNVRFKHVSVNSIFRPNYYNTQSSNFSITLPETINNVISMRISSINIPIQSIYNISEELGNNSFKLDISDISLTDGYYSFTNDGSNSIIKQLIKQNSTILSNDISININSINNKVSIISSLPIKFADENSTVPLTLTLGWLLGFRAASYTISPAIAEAPISNKPREFYIAINDFQNNAVNKFSSAFSESLLPDNIITKINYKDEFNLTFEETVERTRYYDGPTQINKLSFTIYDEYGRIVNLNNDDWSCVLTVEHYRAVQN